MEAISKHAIWIQTLVIILAFALSLWGMAQFINPRFDDLNARITRLDERLTSVEDKVDANIVVIAAMDSKLDTLIDLLKPSE